MKTAIIREMDCVGCTKCILACPVDAIIGAPEFLHSVLTDECIGCGLCITPCPMDCIEMVENPIYNLPEAKSKLAKKAKQRYQARQKRLLLNESKKLRAPYDPQEKHNIQLTIEAAVQRVQQKRDHHGRKKIL